MSNLVRTMEKRSKGIKPGDVKAISAMKNGSKSSIDFGSRVLDNALYVKVPTGEFKVGNATDKLNDIPVALVVSEDLAGLKRVFEFLDNLEAVNITRVILDNVIDFKIMAFDEFYNGVKAEVAKRRSETIIN